MRHASSGKHPGRFSVARLARSAAVGTAVAAVCLWRADLTGDHAGWLKIALLAALAVSAAAGFDAVVQILAYGRITSRPRHGYETPLGLVWLLFLVGAIAVWPYGGFPQRYPLWSWCTFVALLGTLVYVMDHVFDPIKYVTTARRIFIFVAWFIVTWATVAALIYAYHVRWIVAGADFFYYIAYARDMCMDAKSVFPGAYSYFPGIYAFWRSVWRLSNGDLACLQMAHVGVVVAVAALLGIAVFRQSRSLLASFLVALAFWTFASRYEAFQGVVEPLAVCPFLVAMAIWNGELETTTRRRLGLATLAFGWGLSAWLRQHAGLLAAGWLVLVAECLFSKTQQRSRLVELLAMPAIACATLIGGILGEGRGLAPLWQGLHTAAAYEKRGRFWQHLYHHIRNDESYFLLFCGTLALLSFFCIYYAKQRHWPRHIRWGAVAMVGSLCALYPLRYREYYHYMLLAIPGILLAATACAITFKEWNMKHDIVKRIWAPSNLWTRWALFSLVLFPFFYTGGNPNTFHFWRWQKPPWSGWQPWYENPPIKEDLQYVRTFLQEADQRLYVLPPHRVEPFVLWGLRASPQIGYGFDPPEPANFPWESVNYFLVISPQFDAETHRGADGQASRRLLEELPRKGFRMTVSLPTMTLYERRDARSAGSSKAHNPEG
jgi:hypothetical protein